MNFDEIAGADIALERQLRLILSNLGNVTEGYDYYQFRCPICGDSQKSRSKKRGYILKKKKPWMYFCHNCFYKKSVLYWMKEFYPVHYKDYYREILRSNGDKKQKSLPKISNPKIKKRSPEKEHTKFFIPIKNGITPLFAKAMRVCIDRKIPEEVWEKWFVAIDGKYKNRLVIPFFDNNGKIYNYQCRALYNNIIPKYLNRIGDKLNFVYNWYNVDKEKPVVVLEGIIDSLMIENSIAICGANKDVNLSEFKEIYYLLDNDETGKKVSIKLLQEENYVFLWAKFKKDVKIDVKDLNELCVKMNKTFTFEELKQYFSKSLYDKVFLV